jgi:hypothetical protein
MYYEKPQNPAGRNQTKKKKEVHSIHILEE